MTKHYHLLVETPQANLSAAMQWLGVSYSTWFNRRHRRVGHLFQGRFKGIVVEPSRGLALSRYLHLNPVRIKGLRLDREARQKGREGLVDRPERELVRERLEVLRGYRWSSYGAYVGRTNPPNWLEVEEVLRQIGGRKGKEQRQAYRQYVENEVREGLMSNPWEELTDQVLLGGEEYIERMKGLVRGDKREQPAAKALQKRVSWEEVVRAVEKVKGEKWEEFSERYGDWGRDLAFYVGRRKAGLTLRELGQKGDNLDYGSVGMALHRFGKALRVDESLRQICDKVVEQL